MPGADETIVRFGSFRSIVAAGVSTQTVVEFGNVGQNAQTVRRVATDHVL